MSNCRECKLRERCIEECSTSPSIKLMMHRAFETGRDTQQMWGWLQENCLLLPQKREVSRPSALKRRLKREAEHVEAIEEVKEVAPSPTKAIPVAAREPTRKPPAKLREIEEREEAAPSRYCLVLQGGQHRIALPANGEIVLGRFDPAIKVTPDVDLSHDDWENLAISRRHARVSGRNGQHEIEDLGSTNGTMVNGKKLLIGQKVQLRPNDRVTLGYCEFVYRPIPEIQTSPHAAPPSAYLRVAFTGHRFPLPSWGEGIVGRSDHAIGFIPDIDLSAEGGEVAEVVARRHVKIVARNGRHYVEDLGSTNGTKLNGVHIRIGELGLLSPGDHLWLGGCVLSYDIELQSDEKGSN
ncbi:MAG: FHA domain-containing protein [Anaerolineae bacterium]